MMTSEEVMVAMKRGVAIWNEADEIADPCEAVKRRLEAHPYHPVGFGFHSSIRLSPMADGRHLMMQDEYGNLGIIKVNSNEFDWFIAQLKIEMKRPGWIRELITGSNPIQEQIDRMNTLQANVMSKNKTNLSLDDLLD